MTSFTRKSIMESFLKLVDERPLNKISVKDIVEDCGINRNTFYYHFIDMPDLIEAIMKEDADRIVRECGGVDSLEACLQEALQLTSAHKSAVYHIYNSASRDIVERYLLEVCGYVAEKFVDNVAGGMEVSDEDRQVLVQFHKCECFGQIVDWLNHGMNTDMERQFFRLCELGRGMTADMLRRSREM